MHRHAGIRDPLGLAAIVEQRRALGPRTGDGCSFRHGIDEKLLGLEDDVVLFRIERHDPADGAPGMLHPERPQRACGKYLEGLAVKQRTARIIRLVIEIIAQLFETDAKLALGETAADLQTCVQAQQARRRRQALHHGFRGRDEKDRLFGFRKAPQHRGSAAGDLARWFQLIERQGVQPRKHQHFAGRIERVNDAAEPLRPVLALGEEHETAAPGLLPLRQQMQRHHAKRR